MPTRNRIRDQRVIYLNGRRWDTAVLARSQSQPFRATYVHPDPGRRYRTIPACWITATAGMHVYLPGTVDDAIADGVVTLMT